MRNIIINIITFIVLNAMFWGGWYVIWNMKINAWYVLPSVITWGALVGGLFVGLIACMNNDDNLIDFIKDSM
jgi:hypothetical protein